MEPARHITFDSHKKRLDDFQASLAGHYEHFLGFPAALDYDHSAIQPFMKLFLNNVGDPMVPAWHGGQSKEFEREVIDFFAKLFKAPVEDYWGYVTNGSTECNLFALYVARQKFPKATVWYSESAHYSAPKNIHLLAMRGRVVRSQPSGEMNYQDLQKKLVNQAGKPVIVVATIGTTMTEAKDNLNKIRQTLHAAGIKDYYIHADAALSGVPTALTGPQHPFDFAAGASSVSISGHKFIGCPMPCGVIISRASDVKKLLQSEKNYTGSLDSTISGSRNGHTPLLLWSAIKQHGRTGFKQRALKAQQLASYTLDALHKIGWKAWRNPGALTVVLTSPPTLLIRKWQMATANGWSHIVCMPGVPRTRIDAFIADLVTCQSKG